ncbi:hypothetical protein [Bradyrhizobium sp. McL0616]|uniref:hypothetical protein n=1 Tax=Bradyrhizobium sp. McL0616 TaxID=3415674 RepID=UPI003CF45F90
MTEDKMSVSVGGAARRDGFAPEELVSVFTRQWRWAVATFAIVALIAITALSSVKPRWEAQATIRIGQVYDVLSGAVRPIEPLQDVLERMRVRSFLRDAVSSKGSPPEDATLGEILATFSVESIPSTGLIRIKARATSADDARHVATALFDRLSFMHEELVREARSGAELLAEQYTQELAGLRETQSNLQKAFSSASRQGADDGPMALATITSAMERNDREMRELERQRFLLLQRNQHQSISTKMIGEVSSLRIASIRRSLVVVFGLVMGLAAGMVVALLRDYFVRTRSQRLSA